MRNRTSTALDIMRRFSTVGVCRRRSMDPVGPAEFEADTDRVDGVAVEGGRVEQRFKLEPELGSAHTARVLAARAIAANDAPSERAVNSSERAVLLISELVSNVVQHAHTAFELVIDITERIIRVEIHDGAAVTDAFRALVNSPPTAVDVTSVSGRGLGLVRSTAINCGLIDKGICGKAVWFELALNGE